MVFMDKVHCHFSLSSFCLLSPVITNNLCEFSLQKYKSMNKTNHPIPSNNHHSEIAIKTIHILNRGGGGNFNFHITNFPFLSSNIQSSPAYGVFISQLIRYARASSSYECSILRTVRLSNKPLGQGYVKERLRSSLRKFYGRYGDLIKQYEVPLSRMLQDILDDHHLQ